MAKTLYLVSCVKTKLSTPAPASDIYTSDWFRMARAYVEARGPWLILSAKHGALDPHKMVEPYEETLSNKSKAERQAWAQRVEREVLARTEPGDTVVFLAGEKYRDSLEERLKASGRLVEVPMAGRRSGEQKQWLKQTLLAEGLEVPARPADQAKRTRRDARMTNRSGRAEVLPEKRLAHLKELYGLLSELGQVVGGARRLADCHGRMEWPERGVYFFFEDGEERSDSGTGPRVVRVGTHAVGRVKGQSFWSRLRAHRGQADGGAHRTSVFRRLIGASLVAREPWRAIETWGVKNSADREVRDQEQPLEALVSRKLGAMPLLWLDVYDEPSSESLRGYIERNSIALLSNAGWKESLDLPSKDWLGHHCPKPKIRASGLWNSNHVDENYDPAFLEVFRELVAAQREGRSHSVKRSSPREPAPIQAPTTREVATGPERKRVTAHKLIQAKLAALETSSVSLSFDEVEEWIGADLPSSARKHNPWWNDRAPWPADGWKAKPSFKNGSVTFRRERGHY